MKNAYISFWELRLKKNDLTQSAENYWENLCSNQLSILVILQMAQSIQEWTK